LPGDRGLAAAIDQYLDREIGANLASETGLTAATRRAYSPPANGLEAQMPGDDGVTYVHAAPLRFEHVHRGQRIALVTQTVGSEASRDGVRELTEHRCPDCGEKFISSALEPDDKPRGGALL
jgi:hypothetical protein